MKRTTLMLLTAMAILLTAVVGCNNPTISPGYALEESGAGRQVSASRGTGTLELYLKDFPLQGQVVTHLWVTIVSVQVHGDTGGWQTVFSAAGGTPYDLLELVEEPAHLSTSELPEDTYTQVRLLLGEDNRIVLADRGEFPLRVPSGQQTGIKIVGEFEIRDGYSTRLVLDFDAQESVKVAGKDRYLLRPTIRIEEVSYALAVETEDPRDPEQSAIAAPAYPRLVIDTFAPKGGGTSNTFLTLIDHAGNVLATDDDGNPDQVNHNGYSRIDYQEGLAAGTYYIEVKVVPWPAGHPSEFTRDGSSPFYGIRVVDHDPGEKFPELDEERENDGGSDDAVGPDGVPLNPVPIDLGEAGARSRAISPIETDVDWFVLVLP